MTTDTPLPPGRPTLRTGEAVFYIPSTQRALQPLAPIPAVMVNNGCRIRLPDGRITCVRGARLVCRGYCEPCAVPAVVDADEQLVCPQCGAPAIAVPPPDNVLLRWSPRGPDTDAMAAHRAAVHPEWTWREARNDARAAAEAIYQGAAATQQRLDLPALKCRYGASFDQEYDLFLAMQFYAYFGDDAAFIAAYEQLKAEQEKPEPPNPLLELLRLVAHAGDGPGGPSKRLDLPPLAITRPAGDDMPDSEDSSAFGVWLRRQLAA